MKINFLLNYVNNIENCYWSDNIFRRNFLLCVLRLRYGERNSSASSRFLLIFRLFCFLPKGFLVASRTETMAVATDYSLVEQ